MKFSQFSVGATLALALFTTQAFASYSGPLRQDTNASSLRG